MEGVDNKQVTVCACASRGFVDKESIALITTTLKKDGYNIRLEPDLCDKAMKGDAGLSEIGDGVILACHPRAIRAMFNWRGINPGDIFDIRFTRPDVVLGELDASSNPEYSNGETLIVEKEIAGMPTEVGKDAWYPVIDKDRCTECGKCHDFCLFGVYAIEDKIVQVVQPQNCKNNCPACARMCPSRAIIFPKYDKSPINGGLAEEETFNPDEMEAIYNERLKYRLQQRRAGVSLLKNKGK